MANVKTLFFYFVFLIYITISSTFPTVIPQSDGFWLEPLKANSQHTHINASVTVNFWIVMFSRDSALIVSLEFYILVAEISL